ncbi:hypothetical protein [Microbacterium sp. SSM24]|uniref:hypothetical protein n=1 Tax=Microbacterium sp. SSM24 TaxID=2991714 RepID=UPI002227B46C|nr:hypothetical protein [Microbacterium sp. SSM24]MCW3494556.1 hypothetical protein [Microbacterium sp. SSM24]
MSDTFIQTDWPVAPAYNEWVGAAPDSTRAWCEYKLRAATWYIDLLERLATEYGFPRLVGIEMALDGALSHLSSAYDAAVAGLIVVAEAKLTETAESGGPQAPKPIPVYAYKWELAWDRLHLIELAEDSTSALLREQLEVAIEAAIGRDPKGWLTTLRDLRNRTTHHDTLKRFIDVKVGLETNTRWHLTIDDAGVDPVAYLREAHHKVDRLIHDRMLPLIDALGGTSSSAENTIQGVSIQVPAALVVVPPAHTTLSLSGDSDGP